MMIANQVTSALPKMVPLESGSAPASPTSVAATGVARAVLADIAIKTAYILPQFTAEDIAKRMHLPQVVIAELLEAMRTDNLLEVLGHSEQQGYRYNLSQRGRERAQRQLDISGYIGPAPVSLDAYTAMFEWDASQPRAITPKQVGQALGDLVLDSASVEVAGMAVSSGRSLFVSGPPGNGKTSMGRALHNVMQGEIWIPHAIAVDNHIIRLYDTHCHQAVEVDAKSGMIDARWIKVKRPFVVAGGEMTLESLDMTYLPSLKYYEAPLHMKANGGTFLIDDFGRQHVEPSELLNRWIIPLEHRVDFLTLFGGQKIQVPFLLMLIIATNLRPEDVTDPAFLRRIGYRLTIDKPTPDNYNAIFRRYAERYNITVNDTFLKALHARYEASKKELRACEPRDLIERMRDICLYRGEAVTVNEELLGLAWKAYFGG
ncbi:MAG: hypothetical protein LW823_05805 [Rickettsiales bacterium]|jgi:predicted ATPase with chaperone activity|nr:hypothetical protein [Rickettsiales bacterium]